MTRCIKLDMECATICYAAAQVKSVGGQTAKKDAVFVRISARPVATYVQSTKKWNTAGNIRKHATGVPKNAAAWLVQHLNVTKCSLFWFCLKGPALLFK